MTVLELKKYIKQIEQELKYAIELLKIMKRFKNMSKWLKIK